MESYIILGSIPNSAGTMVWWFSFSLAALLQWCGGFLSLWGEVLGAGAFGGENGDGVGWGFWVGLCWMRGLVGFGEGGVGG